MANPAMSSFPVESANEPKPPSRKPQAPSTPEAKFWGSFKNSQLSSGLIHSITSLAFSPAPPHDLAASVSASVILYDGRSLSPKSFSPLTHFTDVSYSPSFRCDGALLAVGDESGVVQVFDPNKARPVLRRLRAHSRAVRIVRYPQVADKVHLLSGGDDAVLNYWDAAAETQLSSFSAAHKDYIRAGSASPVNPEVFATGSYDHMVKLWDVRVSPDSNSISGFNHGYPVESIQFLPSGSLLATAGGNCVKIWDVIGGGRLLHTLESHNKTVTSICIGKMGKDDDGGRGGESRLLSVSIDGYLKVFDYTTFKITHSMRYPSMLLSVASSPTGLVRVVGTNNGIVYIGKKKEKKEETQFDSGKDGVVVEGEEKPALRPTHYRYFQRGQSEKPSEGDYVVKRTPKVKLAEHDKLLKKFRHKEALVSALKLKNPNSIVAVLEELVARKKLLKCVTNLDADELGLLLRFLQRYATMPRYARFLIGLTQKVLQMRADDILSSEELRCHVRNLKRMVTEEIQIQHSLQEIQGIISPLIRIAGR